MSNNKKDNKPDEISNLDKGLDIVNTEAPCGRCLKKCGNDFKIYDSKIYRCKECSILVEHWLKSEFKKKAFDL